MSTIKEGVKVLCKLSFEEATGDFANLKYGECKSVPYEMKDDKLFIETFESSAKNGIQKTSIIPNTSFAVFPSKSDHMMVPSISLLHDHPHHSTSHYFPLKPEREITFCTPLQCLTIPFTSYFTLQPLDSTTTPRCPPNRKLFIDYQKSSPNPQGVCIHDTEGENFQKWRERLEKYKNSENDPEVAEEKEVLQDERDHANGERERVTGVKELQILLDDTLSSSSSHFYYLTLSLTLDNFINRSNENNDVSTKNEPLIPSTPDDSPFPYYVYRLPSTAETAKGVSITHQFFPIPSTASPLYTLRTPRHVYSLSKDESGKFQLVSHLGEEGEEQVAEKIRQGRDETLAKEKANSSANNGNGTDQTARTNPQSLYERGSGCIRESDWKISRPLHSLAYEAHLDEEFPFVGELPEPALYCEPSWSSPPAGEDNELDRYGLVSLNFFLDMYRLWEKAGKPMTEEEVKAKGLVEVDKAYQPSEYESWLDTRRHSFDVYLVNQGIALPAGPMEQKATNPITQEPALKPSKKPEGTPWEMIACVALVLVLILGLIGVVIRNKRRRSKRSSLDSPEAALVNQEDSLASP